MSLPYDIRKIMEMLPHRYPFILVDRILELEPGNRLKALKNVTINEPFFRGHFPDNPIMPGVLILEAMGQAGGVLAIESAKAQQEGKLGVYFSAMDRVRFRKPVVPGDQLIFEIRMIKQRTNAAKMFGTAKVDEQTVAEAEMMAAIGADL